MPWGSLQKLWIKSISNKNLGEIFIASAWALSARLLAAGLGLLFSIIVGRFYGADALGILAVINSFFMLASIFTMLGTNTSILRLIPEHLTKYSPTSAFHLYRKTLCMAIGYSILISSLCLVGSSFIAENIFNKPHFSYYFSLAAGFVGFNSLMLINTQAVRALMLVRPFALMQILPQSLSLALLILFAMLFPGINVPIYAMLCGFALTGIVGWVIMENAFKNLMHRDDIVKHVRTKEILIISLPMALTATMNFVISETGVIMLGILRGESEIGFYAIAVKLATLTTVILTAVNSIVAPKFSELFYSGKIVELIFIAKTSAKLIFWATTPILFGFAIMGWPLLRIVFGPEFVAAYPALLILVLGQFVNSVSGSTGYFMTMTGRQKQFFNIMIVAAITNVVTNIILISRVGMLGAAIAAMISECVWNLTTLYYIKVKFGTTTGYFPPFHRRSESTTSNQSPHK